jgi:hypothetical protein
MLPLPLEGQLTPQYPLYYSNDGAAVLGSAALAAIHATESCREVLSGVKNHGMIHMILLPEIVACLA